MRSQKIAQAAFLTAVFSASACALVLGDFEKGTATGTGGGGGGNATASTGSGASTGSSTTATSTGSTTANSTTASSTTASSTTASSTGTGGGTTTSSSAGTGGGTTSSSAGTGGGTTTSSSTGTGGAPPTGCLDAADETAMAMHALTLAQDQVNCGLMDLGNVGAVSSCLQTTDGLTAACADCYAGEVECALQNCIMQCQQAIGSAACSACLVTNCGPAFAACSGLPACSLAQFPCQGACVDLLNDNDNCGACSNPCGSGQVCGNGDGTCGNCNPPGKLYPPNLDAGVGTLYCPFSGFDGGPDELCAAGFQHCCEMPANAGPSVCQPPAVACTTGTGYIDWQCQDPVSDCTDPDYPVCCATGATIVLGPMLSGMQCANVAPSLTQTTCVTAGACQGITICTSDGECPPGQTCTPFTRNGEHAGGCM